MNTHPVSVAARGWGWRPATRRAWALREVDLELAAGERVLLLGPSGSGKSTLLAGLAGLLDGGPGGTGDEEGILALDGVAAREARHRAVASGRARTGLLLQDPSAQTVLARCGDDVAFGLENHAVPAGDIWPRVREALEGVGFGYGTDHPTSRLSGGQRQRLALAGVLALRPGLLLLDEPTAMLDAEGAALLRESVERVLALTGATCLIVEHRVSHWVDLVDRVVVLERGGGVVADGDVGPVLRARGESLAAHGVWVPGREPRPARTTPIGAAGAALLQAEDLAVRRVPGGPLAVRGVELSLTAGRATCVTGPNGSGKSTLALALAGLLAPASGSVRATAALDPPGSRAPIDWRPDELVSRIGTVFQEPAHQFLAATCADELAVGPRRIGVDPAEIEARVAELLERLGLSRLAAANPFTLSGGEQRRLSVATVLACRPRVLLLDEPTFGQDAVTWAELVDLLDQLRGEGAAVAAITHDDLLVTSLADDVLRLECPRVSTATGRPGARDE